jgi:hypothetical protein
MGFIGGYLNPVLLSTGENQQVALLTYVTILDLGVLVVAFFRNWKWLNIFAFAATALISASTVSKPFRPMVRFATISINAAPSAAFKAAELPPPGTGSPDAVLAR